MFLLLVPNDVQPLFGLNQGRVKSRFEPYLHLTPVTPLVDEKEIDQRIFPNECSLPCLSSKIHDQNQSCSTLDTFTETPPHFDFDDYQLDQSPQQTVEQVFYVIDLCSVLFIADFPEHSSGK